MKQQLNYKIYYDETRSNIESQLKSLQKERQELQNHFQNIQARILEIDAHETPLLRVLESLTELQSLSNSAGKSIEFLDSSPLHNQEISIVEPPQFEISDSANVETVEVLTKLDDVVEADSFDESFDEVKEINEILRKDLTAYLESDDSQTVFQNADFVETLDEPANLLITDDYIIENTVDTDPKTEINIIESETTEQPNTFVSNSFTQAADLVYDFDATEFYLRFPHITPVHPVHILTKYLLEYFGFGLKLSQIARLVERLGYKHNSRNFTDSVHSALKNKRKTTGEFRFNAAKSVWELSDMQKNDDTESESRQRVSDDSQPKSAKVAKPKVQSGKIAKPSKNNSAKPKPKMESSDKSKTKNSQSTQSESLRKVQVFKKDKLSS